MISRSSREAARTALANCEERAAELERDVQALRNAIDRPHFVGDYNRLVRDLIAKHPLDEAMSLAVGGFYVEVGQQLVGILRACGLVDGMSVVDLGCGSGRVAHALGHVFQNLSYVGIDVVQELLDYAATKSPPDYRFLLHHDLSIPVADTSVDMVIAFSVFTHLLHEESYIYLSEALRVLRPGGVVVFTVLESERNWPIFEAMVGASIAKAKKDHLNIVVERPQIRVWAARLGFELVSFDLGGPHEGYGQTVVLLRKA